MRLKWILILVLFSSCSIQRNLDKGTDFDQVRTVETITLKRKPDTLFYTVPRAKYKDTTITRVSEERTILKTVYSKEGRIDTIYCIAPPVEETSIKEKTVTSNDTYKRVDSKWRTIDWFYIGALVAIFLLLLIKLPSLKK